MSRNSKEPPSYLSGLPHRPTLPKTSGFLFERRPSTHQTPLLMDSTNQKQLAIGAPPRPTSFSSKALDPRPGVVQTTKASISDARHRRPRMFLGDLSNTVNYSRSLNKGYPMPSFSIHGPKTETDEPTALEQRLIQEKRKTIFMDMKIKTSPQSIPSSPSDYVLSLDGQQQQRQQQQEQPCLAILPKEMDSQTQHHQQQHPSVLSQEYDTTTKTIAGIDASEQALHNSLVATTNTRTDLQQLNEWADVWVQQHATMGDIQQLLVSDAAYKAYATNLERITAPLLSNSVPNTNTNHLPKIEALVHEMNSLHKNVVRKVDTVPPIKHQPPLENKPALKQVPFDLSCVDLKASIATVSLSLLEIDSYLYLSSNEALQKSRITAEKLAGLQELYELRLQENKKYKKALQARKKRAKAKQKEQTLVKGGMTRIKAIECKTLELYKKRETCSKGLARSLGQERKALEMRSNQMEDLIKKRQASSSSTNSFVMQIQNDPNMPDVATCLAIMMNPKPPKKSVPQPPIQPKEPAPQHTIQPKESVPQHPIQSNESLPQHPIQSNESLPQHPIQFNESLPQLPIQPNEPLPPDQASKPSTQPSSHTKELSPQPSSHTKEPSPQPHKNKGYFLRSPQTKRKRSEPMPQSSKLKKSCPPAQDPQPKKTCLPAQDPQSSKRVNKPKKTLPAVPDPKPKRRMLPGSKKLGTIRDVAITEPEDDAEQQMQVYVASLRSAVSRKTQEPSSSKQ